MIKTNLEYLMDWSARQVFIRLSRHPFIDNTMRQKILQRLAEIESKNDVKVLFAVESGSRAWGFASKDSDYDVRFVYIHRKEWYLSLIEGRDVIEELDPDGVLDLAGWDLKKALTLMGKGNCAFAEWLNSPLAY